MAELTTSETRVPFVDLRAQYAELKVELIQKIESVLDGMHLFLGPNVEAFEREFAAYCGSEFAIAVDSGTSALYLSLRALGVGPGDEVITVANTFIATVGAIVQTGATPVFVDVREDTLLMDIGLVEDAITARTKAIVPVHLYGRMVDMRRLADLARVRGVEVVEDACQAHGASFGGRHAGSWGKLGCFSFYFSKNLGAYGETGLITTSDPNLRDRLRALRDHGSSTKYHHATFGCNARPDELQAVILRTKMPRLSEWTQRRREHAKAYRAALEVAGLDVCLAEAEGGDDVHHLFVVRVRQRDAVAKALREQGIETGIHYPVPVHKQQAWAEIRGKLYTLPVTETAAAEILSLPIYPELTHAQRDLVVTALAGQCHVTAG